MHWTTFALAAVLLFARAERLLFVLPAAMRRIRKPFGFPRWIPAARLRGGPCS